MELSNNGGGAAPVQVIDPSETETYATVKALLDDSTPRDVWEPLHLEAVRDHVNNLNSIVQPTDLERPLDQAFFRYDSDGFGTLSFADISGGMREGMRMTKWALTQLAQKVLPGNGLKFMEGLRRLGETGRSMSEINWAIFLREQIKPSKVRTLFLPHHGHTIRAVVSQQYATTDNIDVLNALLESPIARELPVLSIKVTEDALRIRLGLDPEGPTDDSMETLRTHGPIPMLEIWNGETGRSSTNGRAGLWKLVCLNGMTGFDSGGMNYRWIHSGGAGRTEEVQNGVKEMLEASQIKTSGTVEAYKVAQDTAVQNAKVLLMAWSSDMAMKLTQEQTYRSIDALDDPTTTPGGSLASVVDGITLAAQAEQDMFSQFKMEQFAGRVMARGLREAKNGKLDNIVDLGADTQSN